MVYPPLINVHCDILCRRKSKWREKRRKKSLTTLNIRQLYNLTKCPCNETITTPVLYGTPGCTIPDHRCLCIHIVAMLKDMYQEELYLYLENKKHLRNKTRHALTKVGFRNNIPQDVINYIYTFMYFDCSSRCRIFV